MRIKSVIATLIILGLIPTTSLALDKEGVLKYFIDSSYPETSTINESEENNNKENEKEKISKEKSEKDDNYLKVHVGEQNLPVIENEDENSKESTSTASFNESGYTNDTRITKEKPRFLIYHTHTCETYADNPEGNYHSTDRKNTVVSIGDIITNELTGKGWGVAHNISYHDNPQYNGAYDRSLKTIQNIVNKNKSIDIAIDVHRDALELKTDADKKRIHDKYTANINGTKAAKFYFVVGGTNSNANQLKKLAEDITKFAESKYPGITIPVLVKNSKYNQFVAKNHMLVEIGSNANTKAEAETTAKYLADILDQYYKQ